MYRYNVQVFTILLYAMRDEGINEILLLLITVIIAVVIGSHKECAKVSMVCDARRGDRDRDKCEDERKTLGLTVQRRGGVQIGLIIVTDERHVCAPAHPPPHPSHPSPARDSDHSSGCLVDDCGSAACSFQQAAARSRLPSRRP